MREQQDVKKENKHLTTEVNNLWQLLKTQKWLLMTLNSTREGIVLKLKEDLKSTKIPMIL